MKNTLIAIVIIIVLAGIGIFVFMSNGQDADLTRDDQNAEQRDADQNQTEDEAEQEYATQTVIGSSVEGRDITAYHFGTGDTEILLIGGIHGGYSWNTALLGNEFVAHFNENEGAVPEGVRLTVIPVMNPDGLNKVVSDTSDFVAGDVNTSSEVRISGRFNENGVDLNRNFDCVWQAEGVWQSRSVSGGDEAFSEPESQAVRDYVENSNPDAVVVYYSSAGGVFASSCNNGVSDETAGLTNLYAEASGYAAFQSFDFYEITGDMVNWLAKENVPAISVLLTNHTDIEWDKNIAGVEAMIEAAN